MIYNDGPLISVIITTFNRVDLVREAIASVLGQTYPNFELIIADDGSTDNTKDMVFSFDDFRIVFLELKHSGLPAVTRNSGIEVSKGEFVALLDSDDFWLPHKLERCISHFSANSSTGLFCSNEYLLKKVNHLCERTLLQKNIEERYVTFKQLFEQNIVSTSTVVVRRECLKAVGYFDESIDFFTVEDWHLWVRIAAQFNIFFSNEPLGYYRIHGDNICLDTGISLVNKYNAIIDIAGKFPQLIEEVDGVVKRCIRNIAFILAKHYLRKFKFGKTIKWLSRSL